MFKNRVDAGRHLAKRVESEYKDTDAVVLAIPRGGVVVADEVARALNLQMDLIIPRKIGAPGNPELAIGAVAMGKAIINTAIVRELGIPDPYIESETKRQIAEIARRRRLYLGDKGPIPLEGRVAIVIDDGLATGYTALAAVTAVKQQNPSKTILAVPVAPTDTCEKLEEEVDEIVCLEAHELFFAVGQFYEEFDQTTDQEVIDILKRYR